MEFDATFFISIISFVVFIFIMNAIFYRPILKIMDERNKFVEDNFTGANSIKEQIQRQEIFHSSELETTRNTAHSELDNKIQQLKNEKSKTINLYKKELLENAEHDKENLRKSAFQAKELLKDSVVDIAQNISNIILGSEISYNSIDKSQIHIKEEQV